MTGRRAVMAGLVALALCVGMVAGCGQGGSSEDGNSERIYLVARNIDDGAPKYFEAQEQCPVCDANELQAQHYADVDGKRIYFHDAECEEAFKENRSRYLEKLDKRKQEASGEEK